MIQLNSYELYMDDLFDNCSEEFREKYQPLCHQYREKLRKTCFACDSTANDVCHRSLLDSVMCDKCYDHEMDDPWPLK
jgi:hypothetical protein